MDIPAGLLRPLRTDLESLDVFQVFLIVKLKLTDG